MTIPAPPVVSGHPWKVELLGSILLFIFLIVGLLKFRSSFIDLFKLNTPVFRPVFVSLFLFSVWSGISFLWAGSASSVFHHTLVWGVYLTLFIFAHALIPTGRSIRPILIAFALASAVLTISCVVDYLSISEFAISEGTLRIRYGKYAELLLTIAPVLWAISFYPKSSRRSQLFLLAGAGAWLTAMLSLSKGAFVSGVVAFAVLFVGGIFFSKTVYRPRILKLAGLWLVLTVVAQIIPSMFTAVPSTSDYISGSADRTRETSNVRLFIWSVSRQMIESNWAIGVGADNFGVEFNPTRPPFEAAHPSTQRDVAEYYLAERAHNEFLQIFAELGIVGLLLFSSAFVIFAYYATRALAKNRQFSPLFWGSAAGVAGFLISSQFSSFSFRVMQNGIVFFLVFAIAIYELSKTNRQRHLMVHPHMPWVFAALAFAATLLLFVHSSTRGLSYVSYYQATQATEPAEIEMLYKRAEMFDSDNGGVYFTQAQWSARQGDHKKAAELFRTAIDKGLGVTASYSLMAKSELLSGSPDLAEKTLKEMVSIFPRSIFARVRYAVILEELGKPLEAAEQLSAAQALDRREANGWYHLIKEGSTSAIFKANADPEIAKPADLRPENAVYEFLDNRVFGAGSSQPIEDASKD